jgi:hypothetical protein
MVADHEDFVILLPVVLPPCNSGWIGMLMNLNREEK